VTPGAVELLATTATVLRELAPTLPSDGRYIALLTANAVATARREAAVADRLAASAEAIGASPAAIRAGRHDDDADLYRRLLADAALRAWVADPNAPSADERSAFLRDLPG
jgi:hypothetical protein